MRLLYTALLLMACLHAVPASAAMRFVVQDENGGTLLSGRTVSLVPGRAAIPAEAYEHLGLSVRRDLPRGKVEIFMRESDYGKGFRAGSRQVLDYPSPLPASTPTAWRSSATAAFT